MTVRPDPRPGDLMRMSRSKVKQVKLDLRRANRGRRGANLVQEEVVPLYTHDGWRALGGLSRHDIALVVAVPRTPRVMCLVLTLSGRLLALHRMQFADGMVEFF